MLAHPTLDHLHALGLYGLAKGFKELEHRARSARPRSRRMARPAARIRADAAPAKAVRNARQGVARLRHPPASRTSTIRVLAGSTARSSSARRLRLDRRAPQPARHRGQWPGQELARLRARPQGVPREHVRPLHPHARLFADLAIAHGDARYARLLRSLARVKLLILDRLGTGTLTPDQARDLLEIVEDRYDKARSSSPARFPSTAGTI